MGMFAGSFIGSFIILSFIYDSFLASNGNIPKSIRYKLTPRAQMSILVEELKVNPEASYGKNLFFLKKNKIC
jgi:hypothetical protein